MDQAVFLRMTSKRETEVWNTSVDKCQANLYRQSHVFSSAMCQVVPLLPEKVTKLQESTLDYKFSLNLIGFDVHSFAINIWGNPGLV